MIFAPGILIIVGATLLGQRFRQRFMQHFRQRFIRVVRNFLRPAAIEVLGRRHGTAELGNSYATWENNRKLRNGRTRSAVEIGENPFPSLLRKE